VLEISPSAPGFSPLSAIFVASRSIVSVAILNYSFVLN
jgi:hypothetical protein